MKQMEEEQQQIEVEKREASEIEIQVKAIATIRIAEAREKQRIQGRGRLQKGTTEKIIQDVKEEIGGSALNVHIAPNTLLQRIRRGINLAPRHPGSLSFMDPVEPFLAAIVGRANQLKRPIGKSDFMNISESLIAGTPIEENLRKRKWSTRGEGYWRSFKRRHAHLLETGNHNKLVTKTSSDVSSSTKPTDFSQIPKLAGGDSRIHAILERNAKRAEAEFLQKRQKEAEAASDLLHDKVLTLLKEKPNEYDWDLEDYGIMLQFYNRDEELFLAPTLEGRRTQWELRKQQPYHDGPAAASSQGDAATVPLEAPIATVKEMVARQQSASLLANNKDGDDMDDMKPAAKKDFRATSV
eukprot:CAMPEP_0116833148 /NCGR_PEP_ID=MMETSP0418-20121206/6277_1 /TAXON_ID=1158023 /ORGANISM="Astrosyne radiata, Strain 13vi08-1A" /LENGTH=353 /DNA_ID=CAMNT_0004462569 /DNA_START=36 /DNA_END=1097 /DNA_ORIENTATION=+